MPPKKRPLTMRKYQQSNSHKRIAAERRARRLAVQAENIPGNDEPVDANQEAGEQNVAHLEDVPVPPAIELHPKAGTSDCSVQAVVEKRDAGVLAAIEVQDKETSVDCKSWTSDAIVQAQEFLPWQSVAENEVASMKHMQSLGQRLQMISVEAPWLLSCLPNAISIFAMSESKYPSVEKCIHIDEQLSVNIQVLHHTLKNNHGLWDNFVISADSAKVSCESVLKMIVAIDSLNICRAVKNSQTKAIWDKGVYGKRGVVEKCHISEESIYRSHACDLLTNDQVCRACITEENNMIKEVQRIRRRANETRDLSKVNLRYYARHELILALREARDLNSRYKQRIKIMQGNVDAMIAKEGESISKEWSNEFQNINKANFEKMTDIQKLFWDQQMKAVSLKSKKSMRWHPMMIRMALHFNMISASNYESMRDSGIMTLPSKRTLFDYSHAITSQEGCQEILQDIKNQLDLKCSQDHEKYVCLMLDEMHIRSNLVYQKSSGEMIGYVKLDEVEAEFENLQSEWSGELDEYKPPVATSVLVYMVRNITANKPNKTVKSVVAMYSSKNMSAAGLFTRSWDVIYHLESAGIPVLVVVCDGASTNRKFIKMHVSYSEQDVVHSTLNLAASESRPLFFIIDAPHLIKTLRTALAISYFHRKTRKLWRNGEELSWMVIVDYYERHKCEKLRKAHRLSASHVYLTNFSIMKVSLAVQVLSKTLAQAIDDEANMARKEGKLYRSHKETVEYMRKANEFFDCTNGHNPTSHLRFRNILLAPYTNSKDNRFGSMQKYLLYFKTWEKEVMIRAGNFSKSERKKMFIPQQTYTGLQITIPSFIGAVKFLIQQGAKEVCGRRFCQDPLEQMFSTYRLKGGSSNNPLLLQVQHTRINVHAQKQAALPSQRGNTMVEKDQDMFIDNAPVPKRPR